MSDTQTWIFWTMTAALAALWLMNTVTNEQFPFVTKRNKRGTA